jgi:hypothetical protein
MPDDPQHPNSTQGGVTLGEGAQLTIGAGDVVGRDKIVTNIQNIYQHALSAVEEAKLAHEFERQELAQGVSAFVNRLQARAGEAADAKTGGPYKGLLEYRLSDAELFFGRESAIRELLQNLGRGPLTVLHSESGAGKTSLLQAGLSPRLIANGHLPIYLRPYNLNPALALKRAFLSDLPPRPDRFSKPVRSEQESMRDFLRKVCEVLGPQTTLYVFIDQFEEFFTRLEDAERGGFVNELAECLEDDGLNVRWVLALRSEYFGNLANFRPRIRNPFENDYRLNRLTRAEAQEVIAKPAEKQDFKFETGLIEALLDDLGKNEIAPPQIQLVCLALFEELESGQTLITRTLYEREGGAAGILRGHLERVLSRDLRPEQRTPARRLLEALVTSEQRRIVRSRNELVAELTARGVVPETLDVILSQLIDSRLLKADETESGLAYELVHDYLLGEIKLDPELQARKAAQELLEQETQTYRRFKTLITAERLAILEPYIADLQLTPDAEQLLAESKAAIQRQKAEAEAQQQRELKTLRKLARSQEEAARFRPKDTPRPIWLVIFGAFVLLILCSPVVWAFVDMTPTGRMFCGVLIVLAIALVGIVKWRNRKAARVEPQAEIEFSSDSTRLISVNTDGEARLWDTGGKFLKELRHGGVASARFSPDGTHILTTSRDQTARVWDIKGVLLMKLQSAKPPASKPVSFRMSGSFSPDGLLIVTTLHPGYAQIWEATTGQLRVALQNSFDGVFSPDGRRILTISDQNTARLWTVEGNILAVLQGHTGAIRSTCFSLDGVWMATASADHTARIWNADGEEVAVLKGHSGTVRSVHFGPDSAQLLTASDDHTARLWDRGGNPLAVLDDHQGVVFSARFSPDGTQILTASNDGTAKIWSAEGRYITEVRTGAQSAHFSPDGQLFVTVGDNIAELWDRGGQPVASLEIVTQQSV